MAINETVSELRAQLEPLLVARAQAAWRAGAEPLDRTEQPPSPFSREESFHAIREAREGASERARARLGTLLELSASEVETRLSADAEAELRRTEREGRVRVEQRELTPAEAREATSRESDRERRAAVEQGLADFSAGLRGPTLRRLERAGLTAERLGFPDPIALRDAVTGVSHAAWGRQGESLLGETSEGYRDLLAHALSRVTRGIRPLPRGEAARHDVLHAARVPWMDALLPRESLLPALQRWTSELGWEWTQQKRILVDLDETSRPGGPPFAVALAVPEKVRLWARRERGISGWGALLRATTHAQRAAQIDGNAPPEDRWLGDPSVPEAFATLSEQLLLEPRWLMRYVRLTSAQARELARLAAFSQLTHLRLAAARLAFSLEVLAGGGSTGLEDAWTERSRAALWAESPRGLAWGELSFRLGAVSVLRAHALTRPLHRVLQERFDEDWWRNPSAGRFLSGLFFLGGRDDAEAVGKSLNDAPLTLAQAGERLLGVMSA
jgi:hypothetical protein